ncbi:MAG: hypothetical protein P4L90_24670 [Rhodopila sp.]|nr:hypothetical protein [Rhodopila sp.]
MFAYLRTIVRRHIVSEVPDELSACLDCGAVQCLETEFRTCPTRLARATALDALQPPSDRKLPECGA